jgi:diguanylate cyclase (GGDEF)-like protein/PAS domain S-box-containing protein
LLQGERLPIFRSISTRLAVVFVAAAIVPLSIAMILNRAEGEQAVVAHTRRSLEQIAHSKHAAVEAHVGALRRVAAVLATDPDAGTFLKARREDAPEEWVRAAGRDADNLLRAAQEANWGASHHIFLIDDTGLIVLSPAHADAFTPYDPLADLGDASRAASGGRRGQSLAALPELEDAMAGPVVTDLFSFPDRDHNLLLLLHPVVDSNGLALGAVVVEVAIDAIERLLAPGSALDSGGRVYLATRDGKRIGHSRSASGAVHARQPGLRQAMRTGQSWSGVFQDESGAELYGLYRRADALPWLVCLEADWSEALAQIAGQRRIFVWTIAVSLLTLAVVGAAYGRYFGRPLGVAARQARRIAQGALAEPITISRRDEVGLLQTAIEAMRRNLLSMIESRDAAVAERTDALSRANDALVADIERRKEIESRLLESEQRYALAVRGSKDGLWDWDLLSGRIYYAPRWMEMLGLSAEQTSDGPEEWLGRIIDDDLPAFQTAFDEHLSDEAGQFENESRMRRPDGEIRWMLCRGAVVRDSAGRAVRVAGSLADITDIKHAQAALRAAAEHDRLTGLANREVLRDRIAAAIAEARRDNGSSFAVLFLDFDRFKDINDSLGHAVGDDLLVSVAERLGLVLRDGDTAARFGGDEFAVLLTGLDRPGDAAPVAERLLSELSRPHQVRARELFITASIGLVTSQMGYASADDALRDADAAMYQAKAAGRGRVVTFDRAMHELALDRLQMAEELRGALRRGELSLEYQPIVELESGRVLSVEALLRWDHPKRQRIPPEVFIPIAEDNDTIIEIGRWALACACRAAHRFNGRGGDPVAVNVNVSKRQLARPGFASMVRDVLAEEQVSPSWLRLEITESTIVELRDEMVPSLQGVRAMGVQIAMDDFGTGHSSLSGLHQFPIDVLKIDKSFVQGLHNSRNLAAVVHAIVTLAHHLGMKIVAEGVETVEHVVALQAHGCDLGQGYHFARPMTLADAVRFAKRDQREDDLQAA